MVVAPPFFRSRRDAPPPPQPLMTQCAYTSPSVAHAGGVLLVSETALLAVIRSFAFSHARN